MFEDVLNIEVLQRGADRGRPHDVSESEPFGYPALRGPMPAYEQLLSDDPAWPELAARVATVGHRVTVLPR